jgi:hypothetical protein
MRLEDSNGWHCAAEATLLDKTGLSKRQKEAIKLTHDSMTFT